MPRRLGRLDMNMDVTDALGSTGGHVFILEQMFMFFCLYTRPLVEFLAVTEFREEGLLAATWKYQTDGSYRHKSLLQLQHKLRLSVCD